MTNLKRALLSILFLISSITLFASKPEWSPSMDFYLGLSAISEMRESDGARYAFSYSITIDAAAMNIGPNRLSLPLKIEMQQRSNTISRRFQSPAMRFMAGLKYQYFLKDYLILGTALFFGYEYFPEIKASSIVTEAQIEAMYRVSENISIGAPVMLEFDNENFTFLIGVKASFYFKVGERQ